jgi:hypothetical protein
MYGARTLEEGKGNLIREGTHDQKGQNDENRKDSNRGNGTRKRQLLFLCDYHVCDDQTPTLMQGGRNVTRLHVSEDCDVKRSGSLNNSHIVW